MAGNEEYIGKSPLRPPAAGRSQLVSDVERGFPFLSSIYVDRMGTGELQVRSEVREVVDQKVISSGVLHLVVNFDLDVSDPIKKLPDGEVEFLYLVRPARQPTPDLPTEWEYVPDGFEPITYTMRYPPGDILLYAKPVEGWRPQFAETLNHRLRYGLLGLLLFLPVVLANWFAISRGTTRVHLSKTRQQMSNLLRTLSGAAFTYTTTSKGELPGKDDHVRFLNPKSCKEIFGVDADIAEANVSSLWEIIESPEANGKVVSALTESQKTATTFDQTWPVVTPEGDSRWLHCRAYPSRLADGSTQWSALALDNTEAIKRDVELEKQRQVAFRAQKNETIGQLTGGAAHDFNNVLAVILANLELMSMENLTPSQQESLNSAIDATQRGSDLTNNMLAFARKAKLTPETLSLNEVVHAAQSLLERTLPASVSVELNLDINISNVALDRGSTESALLNLMLNARDAMDDQGVITIQTDMQMIHDDETNPQLSELSAGYYSVLSVSDTGSGITQEHLQHIFEPFYTTKAPGEGSGLGLSMIMGFVQQSDGAVEVITSAQDGTTIKLYFPAVDSKTNVSSPSVNVVATGGNILFAEDDSGVRSALTKMLEKSGYHVVAASSGDEAFRIFKQDTVRFDLLITDLVMPGKQQGCALANAVREISPHLAVVFITGYADDNTALNPTDIRIKKPIKHSDLIEAIENALTVIA